MIAPHIWRLFYISYVLARHGALFFFKDIKSYPLTTRIISFIFSSRRKDVPPGQRLKDAFHTLGPTFIKLGQMLSTRPDLIGDATARDLSELRDRVPSFSTKTAIKIIESEFDRPVTELFRSFDRTPVAAASIAQVHFAIDASGNDVAVKILRPDIKRAFIRDIRLFYWIARRLEVNLPRLKRLRLTEIVALFEQTVRFEMDLRLEAAAASELKENMAQDEGVYVPTVNWRLTTERVMTLERVYGVNIDDEEELRNREHDIDKVLANASAMFFKQVFRDGFFHADMHPGNMLVRDDGVLVLIDFGIMGRVDVSTRMYLAHMLLGFLKRDYKKVADVHFDAGYIPANQSRELFAQACRSIGEPIFDLPQNEISIARLLEQLFRITEDFHMQTQPQLLLLQKTMVLAEGIGRRLNPEANFWELSRPFIEEWGRQNFGLKAGVKMRAEQVRDYSGKMLDMLNVTAANLPKALTDQGLYLHPQTLEMMGAGRQSGNIWTVIITAALVSALVSASMHFL